MMDRSFFTVFGLVLVLFGYKLLRATLVFMGFVAWALITIVIMVVCKWTFASQLFRPTHYLFWMWFLAGIAGGLLALRYWELGLIFTGGFGGFALAMGIIGACDDHLSSTGRYVLLVYLIFVGATLPTFCERFVITISTSFGGAFMFMYGIDEFLQLGYRDIIVVFQFAGRAFSYHADRKVFIMLGSTLAFAVVGIVWEFWWHRTPLWMNEKALFSIRGRPFGKRPHKLMGERLLRRMRRSLCLRLKKAKGMPYGEDQEDSTVKQGQAQNKQYQGQPTIIVVDDGSSNIGKLSNKSDTYIGSDSGISAKTTSSLNVEDADAQEKERAQRWSALSASTLTPPMDELHSKNIQGGGQGQRWSALSSATLSPSIEERNDKDEGNKTGSGSDTKSIQSFEKKGD
ncbi:hypothetical protein BGZ99_002431 [Dissophora globulifera]|uniref:Transmembrane protein 198 n=1 Tax=Dissophora globulifera TaxID=979702 RepID=A0A9P6RMS6_9FUNG|nr:hypothetical protein BGZ99_002431 [Dissophora globulifera]